MQVGRWCIHPRYRCPTLPHPPAAWAAAVQQNLGTDTTSRAGFHSLAPLLFHPPCCEFFSFLRRQQEKVSSSPFHHTYPSIESSIRSFSLPAHNNTTIPTYRSAPIRALRFARPTETDRYAYFVTRLVGVTQLKSASLVTRDNWVRRSRLSRLPR